MMAVSAVFFAFVLAPLGVVFGAIGLGRSKRRGGRGRQLALTGLFAGSAMTLVGVTVGVTVAVLGASVPEASTKISEPSVPSAATAPVSTPAGRQSQSVALTCQEIWPAIQNIGTLLETEPSISGAVERVNGLMMQVNDAARWTDDASFQTDVAAVGATMSTSINQVAASGSSDNTGMVGAIEKVGMDCFRAGWVPVGMTSAASPSTYPVPTELDASNCQDPRFYALHVQFCGGPQ